MSIRPIHLPMFATIALVLAAAGCQRDATLIKWAEPPNVSVASVEVTAVSDEGASSEIELELQSGAEVALPLTFARYTLTMNGLTYQGGTEPNAVLPAGRSLTIRLPAAVDGDPGDRYSVRGTVEYEPPGQIRKVFTDIGIPLPSVGFSGEGELSGAPRRVQDEPAPPTDPAEKPGSEEARDLAGEEQPPADVTPEDLAPPEAAATPTDQP